MPTETKTTKKTTRKKKAAEDIQKYTKYIGNYTCGHVPYIIEKCPYIINSSCEPSTKPPNNVEIVIKRLHQVSHVVGLHNLNAKCEIIHYILSEYRSEWHNHRIASICRPVIFDCFYSHRETVHYLK